MKSNTTRRHKQQHKKNTTTRRCTPSQKPVYVHAKAPCVINTTNNRTFSTHNNSTNNNNANIEDENDFEFDELPSLQTPQSRLNNKSKSITPINHPSHQQVSKSFTKKTPNLNQTFLSTGTISASTSGDISHNLGPTPPIFSQDDASSSNTNELLIHEQDEKLQRILSHKTPLTPLCHELRQHIVLRGPLSMAEYMQFCLGHPQFGYYMQRNAIGKKGDFVTSPEISPLFNEMIGIWGLSTWMRMGRPERLQIVELGPGRGTLMKGFLSAAERFPEFYNALSVHFVENSGVMRKLQRHTLDVTLDLDFMSKHPSNHDTILTNNENIDIESHAALDTAQDINIDDFFQKLTSMVQKGSDLKNEIEQNLIEIRQQQQQQQQQGVNENMSEITISQLRPELLQKLQRLEKEISCHVQSSNGSSIPHENIMNVLHKNDSSNPILDKIVMNEKQQREAFLNSFMKLSTGVFTTKDLKALYTSPLSNGSSNQNITDPEKNSLLTKFQTSGFTKTSSTDNGSLHEEEDEDNWVWSEEPSSEVKEKMLQLQKKEQKLQSELLLLLPRVTIPSHLTQSEQEAKLAAHNKKIEEMIEKDPELKKKIEEISSSLDDIIAQKEEYQQNMYANKVSTDGTIKFNKYMTLPMVCGTTTKKFDTASIDNSLSQLLHKDDEESKLHNKSSTSTSPSSNVKKINKQLHKLKTELPVSWSWTLLDVPSNVPSLILAHEFFDALPVHQFQYTRRGWREILVDADDSPNHPHHFKYVLSPTPTPASVSFLQPTLLQPDFDGVLQGQPKPLHQHTDGHENVSYGDDHDDVKSALQTPGRMHLSQQIDISSQTIPTTTKSTGSTSSSISTLVDMDGNPLHPHEAHRAEQKRLITEKIQGQSLSQSLSALSNPRVLPEDVKRIKDLHGGESLSLLDADGKPLIDSATSSTIIPSQTTTVEDEAMINDIDARFMRQNKKSKRQLLRESREGNNTIDDDSSSTYNSMHGIDTTFEEQRNNENDDVLANSPHIYNKLRSGNKNQLGDTYETSPPTLIWSEKVALHLMKAGGAALFIDYGDNDFGHLTQKEINASIEDNDNINAYGIDVLRGRAYRDLSLQGIKSHRHVDILQEPGLVDLSAHVNFASIGAACEKTQKLTSLLLQRPTESEDFQHAKQMLGFSHNEQAQNFVPHKLHITRAITQSALLQQLGLEERFERLLQHCTTEQEQSALFESVNRLVDPEQMGHLFKAMAIYTDEMRRPPVGWDEHIVKKEHEAYSQYQNKQQLKEIEEQKIKDDNALEEFHERNRLLREMHKKSNEWQTKNEEEYEKRLKKAVEDAGTGGFGSTFIGQDTSSATLLKSSLNAIDNATDAQRALEKLQQQKEAEDNKDYYVVDRNKYGSV